METLATADGKPIDLDQTDAEFAKAMAAPRGDEPEAPAPPKREAPDPEAPYGRTKDGTPRGKPGRKPKQPPPRMTETPKTAPPPKGKAAPAADYTQGLTEFSEALWMVLAATPVPWPEWRVRVRAQAYVLKETSGGLVQGVNLMAQHNGMIRTGVEKLTTGNAGWVLPAVMAVAPFAVQSAMIWRAPADELAPVAAHVEQEWAKTVAAMQAEFEAEAQFMAESAAKFEAEDAGSAPAA